jgi:hypothetical protein
MEELLRHVHTTLAVRMADTGLRRVHLDASSLEACGHMLTAYAGALLAPLVHDTQFLAAPLLEHDTVTTLPPASVAAGPAAGTPPPPPPQRRRKRKASAVVTDDS